MQPQDQLPPHPPVPPAPPVPGVSAVPTQQYAQATQPEPQFLGYDANGRPLYGTPNPPNSAPSNINSGAAQPIVSDQMPRIVHVSRAPAPIAQEVPDEVKAKHDESVKRFPNLNLSEAEYVISAVARHPIGMIFPVIIGVFIITVVLAAAICYPLLATSMGLVDAPGYAAVMMIAILFSILIGIGIYIVTWVYRANTFFLTNESVIQEIQTSLFSKREQTVSLGNIEDASFNQTSVIETMFDYGSIRLSTEGDETTYRFAYVTNPKKQIATLNNAVEAFKNGRPVTDSDN